MKINNMQVELGQKIIDKIKADSLSPKPRWHFLVREWLVWMMGALALIVGAASVSVMRYLAENSSWAVQAPYGQTFAGWLLLSLPYFWLFLLGLFLWLFYYNLKHTKRGYRYPMIYVAGIALFGSILLGLAFYTLGVGSAIDGVLGRKAPLYAHVFNPHIDFWSAPEEGRLAGLVVAHVEGEDTFRLIDRKRGEWIVTYNPRDDIFVVVGQPLRAMGTISGEQSFEAVRIMRMRPGREYFQRFGPTVISVSGSGMHRNK
ncbi:hypothetical protein CVU83_03110 [Candidatus Falkowbacteria bacterium HGW-Falkowbacteria-2]|uniref:Uncharacterized protein n=1 Tax=Candidatus Falkowbacteria bacterium HGW-Falkowbacteria-2 TaxID=2013769 RepID=A0A2N2DY13_9BACT|nr:MAG: hypothetical protein CVU83_03110 [Candidatus Falkowbacteria bacterium HGW-Falkowbacteria-2]